MFLHVIFGKRTSKFSASGQTCGQVRKWACSILEAGKNKPIYYVMKTRDFKRFSEKIKEKRGFVMNPRFCLSATFAEGETILGMR